MGVEITIDDQSTARDGCPIWAAQMIEQLTEVEIYLGNIPKALDWQSERQDLLHKVVFSEEEMVFSEYHTELIFALIVNQHVEKDFSSERIRDFINARIG